MHILEILGAVFLACAVLHTFSVGFFLKTAKRFPHGTVGHVLLHGLGEVEIAFGTWAIGLAFAVVIVGGGDFFWGHFRKLHFTEPFFVAVITLVAATKPILMGASLVLKKIAERLPFPMPVAFLFILLSVGPLLGSLITEPAAMTVVALILRRFYFSSPLPEKCRYAILAVLLVHISIGGVLSHFAAPPVVMVARSWDWDTRFMLSHFGWKAVLAILLSSFWVVWRYRWELTAVSFEERAGKKEKDSVWGVILLNLLFVALVVVFSDSAGVLLLVLGGFLFFYRLTQTHHSPLKTKESLLVGFFLSGVVILGSFQAWWVKPLMEELTSNTLFLGATLLTSVTDNAALTYLGTQIPTLDEMMRYMLVAGAVTGGGLTVIANAPNPIGFAILEETFEGEGIDSLRVLKAALLPTGIAAAALFFL